MIKVKDYKALEIIAKVRKNLKEGERALVGDKDYYVFKNGEWEKCAPAGLQLSLYELNQQVAANIPTLNEEQIQEAKETINDFIQLYGDKKYFMLLGKDLSYYTMFVRSKVRGAPEFADEVIECLQGLGEIKSVKTNEANGTVECWIKCSKEDIARVLYLFEYEMGVIECQ